MKKFSLCLVPLSIFLLAGCALPQKTSQEPRRFREAASVNAVLQFSSWDYTFLTQPRYEDNGFLLQVPRHEVARVLDRMKVRRRELAVVVVGWNYSPQQFSQLSTEWTSILRGCGFQRVVLVKSAGKKLDGAVIVDDSI